MMQLSGRAVSRAELRTEFAQVGFGRQRHGQRHRVNRYSRPEGQPPRTAPDRTPSCGRHGLQAFGSAPPAAVVSPRGGRTACAVVAGSVVDRGCSHQAQAGAINLRTRAREDQLVGSTHSRSVSEGHCFRRSLESYLLEEMNSTCRHHRNPSASRLAAPNRCRLSHSMIHGACLHDSTGNGGLKPREGSQLCNGPTNGFLSTFQKGRHPVLEHVDAHFISPNHVLLQTDGIHEISTLRPILDHQGGNVTQ